MPMSNASARPRRQRGRLRAALATTSAVTLLAITGTAAHAGAATRDLYVANLRGNTVSVVDPTTDTVVATIPVGSFPFGVAVSPDGSQAWVANDGSNDVSVISTSTDTVTATIPVGRFVQTVAFSPDGSRAYVGYFVSPGFWDVAVIDTATDTVITNVPVGNQTFGIALTPDGSRAYVANFISSNVSVIDTSTNTNIATIADGAARTPDGIAASPDGAHVYTANFNSDNVSVIDTATNTISALIPVASGPGSVAVTPDGSHLYVADENANAVSVIDTATGTVTDTIPVGSVPSGVLVDGTTAYVSNGGSNDVSVIDTTTNTVIGTVAVGSFPIAVAQAPALQPPLIAGISPVHGPEAGGDTVTITGAHLTGTTAVDFGGTPATNVTVVNDGTVTAVAPAHADGTVDVTVTTAVGTSSADSADQYTYDEPAPAVTGLSPAQGPLAGGTSVTITGTDLLGATAVAFGATPATSFTVVSDTQITAVAPAAANVGPVDVTVTTSAGSSAKVAADQYAYTYPFAGFFAPVDNLPVVNQVHAGRAIPIKFSLGGDYGLGIVPTGYPTATQVNCATGAPVNSGTLTDTAGGSGLQYDPAAGTYTYVWKTLKAWSGTCQLFTLGLNDTSAHTAEFQFVN